MEGALFRYKNIIRSKKDEKKDSFIGVINNNREACETLGLRLLNLEDIRSRRDYNRYEIEYPLQFHSSSVKPILLVETVYILKAYPDEVKPAASILYDYLHETGNDEEISKYDLQPFPIRVQTLERTLIDKVFAICDYKISDNIVRNSRHIYDLYKLLTKVNLDNNLKELAKEVREDRKTGSRCYSAQDGVNVQGLLSEIIESGVYKDDYETVTKIMMFKYLPYDEAIKAVQTIIDSKVFDFGETSGVGKQPNEIEM